MTKPIPRVTRKMSENRLFNPNNLTIQLFQTTTHYVIHRKNLPSIFVFLLSLTPLFLNVSHFKQLFWFGDELVLLGEMKRDGLFAWGWTVFAESIVPVFKFLWGGAVIILGGSYFSAVTLVWGTHALNATLLFSILQRLKVSLSFSFFAVCLFALTAGTHESLGWTVQWSAILVVTFFLLGLLHLLSSDVKVFYITLCACGAAFSFARGILVCGVLAVGIFAFSHGNIKTRIRNFFFPLIPAFGASAIIFLNSTGNHQSLLTSHVETFSKMVDFGGTFYLLNPLFRIFSDATPTLLDFYNFGGMKIALIVFCLVSLKKAEFNKKIIILLPLLFDLGNAALLGLGRYHTGWQYAVSSRYQYESLLCLSLSLALSLQVLSQDIRFIKPVSVIVSVLLSLFSFNRWEHVMPEWGRSRGKEGREFFFAQPEKKPPTWWGLPNILSKEEAEKVISHYKLH